MDFLFLMVLNKFARLIEPFPQFFGSSFKEIVSCMRQIAIQTQEFSQRLSLIFLTNEIQQDTIFCSICDFLMKLWFKFCWRLLNKFQRVFKMILVPLILYKDICERSYCRGCQKTSFWKSHQNFSFSDTRNFPVFEIILLAT
jgi:hypothetical protein